MDDKFLIWHANQMTEHEKRFAKMMINDLKSLTTFANNERDSLIEKYEMYLTP